MLAVIPLLFLAYCLGSLMTAVLLSRAFGLPNPMLLGSSNPGATNMLRLSGKKFGAMTLIGDFLKGFLPLFAMQLILPDAAIASLVSIALLLGHMYPIFFNFRGGKGVATAIGILMAISWPLALSCMGLWLFVVALSRYVSLASCVAAASAPAFAVYWLPQAYWLGIAVLAILIIARHKPNIKRLWQGQEPKVGANRPKASEQKS
jgi:glycerol-3-phosphate acyltransferase PlsY